MKDEGIMRITIIGTYPPRQCGIATFTKNLAKAIKDGSTSRSRNIETSFVVTNDADIGKKYPAEVKYVINQKKREDYIKAAEFLNVNNTDVCLLQHEFGIFGGDNGEYIIALINRLKIPLIVTFHTVLKNPTIKKKAIMERIASKAAKIVVMSQKAIHFLTSIYQIPREKIELIEHGVPDYDPASYIKNDLFPGGRKILLTFGLLSRNKGLETVIKALPAIIKKHPETLYVILGKTHPGVIRSYGEEYRNYLKSLVNDYNLENHVAFIDKFVSEEQLFLYLRSCDLYITPYLNEAQITSGTLSYAVGAGAAVVSTPYWHAQELLSNKRGVLFDYRDHIQLSSVLLNLLDDNKHLENLKNNAYNYGLQLRWPLIGKKYVDLALGVSGKIHIDFATSKDKIMPHI